MPAFSARTQQEVQADDLRRRQVRLALPAVTVMEWAKLHGHGRSTALRWAIEGQLGAWRSGATWLCLPDTPKPMGPSARQSKKSRK